VNVVDRARADLTRGEPWRARDRLRGTLGQRPHDQALLEELARTYAAMGDLPAAGAVWFLTGRPDGDVEAAAALTAFRQRYPKPWVRATELPLAGRLDAYPSTARARVRALQQECDDAGWRWQPGTRPRLVAEGRLPRAERPVPQPTRRQRVRSALTAAFAVTVVLANIGIYVLGFVMLLRWIWS
jgi:hypothetical protein